MRAVEKSRAAVVFSSNPCTLTDIITSHHITPRRSGRRKKRKDKTSAVVVPSLDAEDAAGEPIDSGEGFEAQEGALEGDGDADMMSSPGAEVEIADSTD